MDTSDAERQLPMTLAAWAGASVVGGATCWVAGTRLERPELAGFGRQMALWGVIDGAIAGAGLRGADKGPDSDGSRRRKLRLVLTVNAAADVGYLALGAAVVRRARTGHPTWGLNVGDGIGILTQGAFLLALDAAYAVRLR